MSERIRFTPADDQVLIQHYPGNPTKDVAKLLGKKPSAVYQRAYALGLAKTPERLLEQRRQQIVAAGAHSRFQPGNTSWNTGKSYTAGGRSAETRFKKGNVNHNTMPVGSMTIRKAERNLWIKVAHTGSGKRDWVAVHHIVWERVHGPAPRGHVIAFKPGMATAEFDEITLDRLELIPRAELMRRNSAQRHGSEIYKIVQLRGCITRQINKRLKAEAERNEA